MRTPKQLAAQFAAIDAHDDTIEGFAILPALTRRTQAKVEITLFSHWEGRRRILRFSGCANVSVAMDADVLSGNAPNNTYVLEATTNSAEIESMVRRHKRSWNVSYQKSIDPLPAKMTALNRYVLFRVRLFGGVLEVLARSFTIKPLASE
jgi:hypothetical protein